MSRNEAMHQFLGISKLDETSTRPPSRSSICRSRQMFPDEIIEAFTRRITELALQSQASEEPASAGVEPHIEAWIDTTAIEPNAHHPVDWILLTDIVRFCKEILTPKHHPWKCECKFIISYHKNDLVLLNQNI